MTIGRFDLMPRSGLEPTVMFDICENSPFTNFAIKAIYGMWNNNWMFDICESAPFTNFAINAIYGIRNNNWITPFTNFTINAIYGMRNNNWIQLLFRIP